MTLIALSDIQDAGAQMRVEMKPDVVLDYADDMAAGAIFPPVVVYHDGADYWLPATFDPVTHPILAVRYFGVGPLLPIGHIHLRRPRSHRKVLRTLKP